MSKVLALAVITCVVVLTSSHVRVRQPPNRSSIWRDPAFASFNPPINYNDDQVWCVPAQQDEDISTCAPCGDRANAAGGEYARGIITGRYTKGQTIEVTTEFTTSHAGYVEFNLCPNAENLACLKTNLLQFSDGSTRRYLNENNIPVTHTYNVRLPAQTTCQTCVLQLTYHAGNNWGTCKNGTEGMGCGLQETFRNCMDIAIS